MQFTPAGASAAHQKFEDPLADLSKLQALVERRSACT